MAYVMIIDDDEDFANAAATVLRGAGHEVQIELAPEDGIENMKKRRPDLVILDVMFPEDSSGGFRLARQIRHQFAELKGTPVLILTAVNSRFPLGFSAKDIDDDWMPVAGFLEKPLDFNVLRNKVSDLLETVQAN